MEFASEELKNKTIDLTVTDNGRFYYYWEVEGITKDGSCQEEYSLFKVRVKLRTTTT